jgi:hypothetical protein
MNLVSSAVCLLCVCVAVVASAWLETLLDVIDLLPATVIKSDVSGIMNYRLSLQF